MIKILVNGKEGDIITLSKTPKRFKPEISFIQLKNKQNNKVLDCMWITINSLETQKSFSNWYTRNSDTNWVQKLPRPSPKIEITTNFWGNLIGIYPNNAFSSSWGKAKEIKNSYLHHNAKFSAKSITVDGGHGNQACYDSSGNLITNTIAGGTADFVAGKTSSVRSHVKQDVKPFIDALQLDGNPGNINWLNEIQRPCLYQGTNLNKYLERRPIIQP